MADGEQTLKDDLATEGETRQKIELPPDATDDERKDFELTGKLELYELRRSAERLEQQELEEKKRVLRERIAKAASESATADEEVPKVACPPDATEMERKDFERTGTLELYELNREADRIQRERIRLRQEAAEREQAEAHKRALRAQAEMDRLTLENERRQLALPPPKDPYEDSKPIPGSERLPEVVKGVLRRLFGYGSGEWTEENQVGLVNMLLAMGNHKSQSWAYEMRDAMAADVYHSSDLSPRAIMQGSTGLKAIAGPKFMGELKAISGGGREEIKALPGARRQRRKGKSNKKKDGVIRVDATRVEEPESSADDGFFEEEVVDDSPNQDAENIHDPWGEFD